MATGQLRDSLRPEGEWRRARPQHQQYRPFEAGLSANISMKFGREAGSEMESGNRDRMASSANAFGVEEFSLCLVKTKSSTFMPFWVSARLKIAVIFAKGVPHKPDALPIWGHVGLLV